MTEVFGLLGYSVKAVAAVLLAAVAGVLLIRTGVVKKESMRVISTLLFYVTLPCLLFAKVAASIDLKALATYWIMPVSCEVFIFAGLGLGYVLVKVVKPRDDFVRGLMTSTAFGNSGYLPIPLIAAITAIFPCFAEHANAEAIGIAYISAYLMCFSPTMWILGYGLISGKNIREVGWKKILTPPVIGMFAGIVVGLCPPLKNLFCSHSGMLNSVFKSAQTLGSATVPCALLVLGANFAYGPGRTELSKRTLAGAVLGKLVILPALALGYVALLRQFDVVPVDLIMAVVLVIEAGVPPANNLVVICNLCNNRIEERMAAVLFWGYLLCIPTLTLFIMLAVKLFGTGGQ